MRKLISITLALAFVFSSAVCMGAVAEAANVSYNNDGVYIRQSTNYTCTLASAAMMLRRRAIMNGDTDWKSISESSMRKTAWVENAGLRNSFTYAGIKAVCKSFSGDTYSAIKSELIDLLGKNPCGIVIYSSSKTHAVFLTDYNPTNGIFYCMDPASTAPSGKITLEKSTLGKTQKAIIQELDCYWYVSSSAYKIGEYTVANEGKGVNLYSSASSSDTKLTKVPDGTVLRITAVTGKFGQTVYSGKTGWVVLSVCDYTTKGYQLIYMKNGASGSQMQNTVCVYGKNNYLDECTYTRKDYHFTGWYLYRPLDYKWLYSNGSSNAWCLEGQQGSGYSKRLMQPGSAVLKLTGYYGGQIFLYAQWKSGNADSAKDETPNIQEPEESPVIDEEAAASETEDNKVSETPISGSGMENFTPIIEYTAGQFYDVDENLWYGGNGQGSVRTAVELGLMNGVGSGCFDPTGEVTIAQAVTIACRLHSIYHTGKDSIVQLPDDWFAAYLDYANANGIVAPGFITDSASAKSMKATRSQFAYILSGAFPDEALPEKHEWTMGSIPDVSESTAYSEQIYTLYRAGIISGSDSAGTFSPNSYIQRCQTAAIIARMADLTKRI